MKKGKLLLSVLSLCFALAVLTFGVFAASTTVEYQIGGTMQYEVTDAFVKVETKIYYSSTFLEEDALYTKIENLMAGTTTGLTEQSLAESIDYNSMTDTASGANTKSLNFTFTSSGTAKLAYFVVLKATNLGANTIWLGVNNEITLPSNVYSVNSGVQSGITQNQTRTLVIALSPENIADPVVGSANNYSLKLYGEVGTCPYTLTSTTVSSTATMPTKLYVPAYINGTKVLTVGAFTGLASTTHITVPNTITTMSLGCFATAQSLTNISVPFTGKDRAIRTGSYIQYGSTSYYPSKDTWFGYIFGDGEVIEYSNSTASVSYAFAIPSTLTSLVITDEDTINGIGAIAASLIFKGTPTTVYSYSFYNYAGTSVVLPNSLVSLSSAFSGKSNLLSINIPTSLTEIPASAFRNCTSLTSIVIPDNITAICGDAFNGCTSLSNITLSKNLVKIENAAFANTPWLSNLTSDSNGMIFATAGTSKYLMGFDNTKIESDFVITADMFCGASVIYGSPFAGSMTNNQTKIKKITIPACVKYFKGTFAWMTKVEEIIFEDGFSGMTEISSDMCTYCQKLTYFDIPYGVTKVNGNGAFSYCNKLETITIPSTVTSLGQLFNTNLAPITVINNASLNTASTQYSYSNVHWEFDNGVTVTTVTQIAAGVAGQGTYRLVSNS